MTATVPGTALGMPMEGVFFNIPTVINGVPMSPEAAAQLTGRLIAAGEIKLDAIPGSTVSRKQTQLPWQEAKRLASYELMR